MTAIALRDVRLTLRDRVVLDKITLDIAAGEFVGVLGPNGAGKTTLMRALLGLVPADGGTIQILGRPATRGNAAIGYLPQTHAASMAARLSGWDFIASVVNGHRLGLPLTGKSGRHEIERALDRAGARALARRPLTELSGGERQRLLLAQALIGNPQLLLLDEPLISLDPRHQTEVIELVKSLQRELRITVLFSAHELNPLLGAIDRVLYLGSGQAALGTVDEVITSPVLSRLYDSEIEVVRIKGRIFVMSGGHELEGDDHRHDAHAPHAHLHHHTHSGHA
ncbi:MAG: metal ABC transporter ATP-binding protein [Stellaceae bacterium]